MTRTMIYKRGFTLIELLVVIGIIGLLATISILALNRSREAAKVTRARADIDKFMKVAAIASAETNKSLGDITGSYCSYCTGQCGSTYGGPRDLKKIPDSDTCAVRWQQIRERVEAATGGLVGGAIDIYRDPWGSPYVVDENECEAGHGSPDMILSPGPDGVILNSDDIRVNITKTNICQ